MLASKVPCMPSMPTNWRSVAGIAAQPIKVLVTGKLRRRASWVSFSAASEDHAAAGVDDRPLGLGQQLDGLLDLPQVPPDHGVVGAHLDGLGILELAHLGRDILRGCRQRPARTAGGGDMEGLLDGDGEILDVLDQEVVLDAGPGDANRIALLESVLADVGGRHLAGEHHHGHQSM